MKGRPVTGVPQFEGDREQKGAQGSSLMRRMVDSIPEGLCLIDSSHRLLIGNEPAQQLLALLAPNTGPRESLTTLGGRALAELLDGEGHEIVLHGPPLRRLAVIAHPVAGERGERNWVLVLRDVTERRRLAENARQQDRLAAVGQLAAGIAHDFNNILSSILLYTQLLADEPQLSPAGRRRLQVMQEQTQRAGDLVTQILDFSRRSVLRRETVDMVELCRNLVAGWQGNFPPDIEVKFRHEQRPFRVWGDADRLSQALLNLATNAREAMPDGGTLIIALRMLQIGRGETVPQLGMTSGEWLQLSIADSGSGMAPETLSHVLEPFFSTKPLHEGAGLGLPQVYGIVQQHDGHVRVESEPHKGTVVTLYLPLHKEAQPGQGVSPEEPDERLILIVEDNQELRRALRESLYEALADRGWRLALVASGKEALDVARRGATGPDLLIGDLVMPQMSGTALLQALRQQNPQCRMIVTSSYPRPTGDESWQVPGIAGWLQKPVSMQTLITKVKETLGA